MNYERLTTIEHLLGKIWNEDCLNFMKKLPDKCVDLVLCDPPYGLNQEENSTGQISKQRGKARYSGIFKDTPEYINEICVPAIKEAIRISTAVIFTPGYRCMCFYPNPSAFGCFIQPVGTGITSFGMSTSQPIFYYGKTPTKKNISQRTLDFKMNGEPNVYEHPCVKPFNSWKAIVYAFTLPGQIVFDPFMGAGTTGAICEKSGRKWLGCELEPKYIEIANKRIEAERNQLKLF